MTTATAVTRTQRHRFRSWSTPIYQADLPGADHINQMLKPLILDAEQKDPHAALFGGIDAIKSCQDILRWGLPETAWLSQQISHAVTALTVDVLGDAAAEVTQGILAEAWAVVYRGGGSLRPHTHHDSAWSGVYYVDAGGTDAGHLQMLDPRPAAVARGTSSGAVRTEPRPGRMVAFPGWLPHSVQATLPDGGLRIAVAWNVAYDKTFAAMS
ncbi:TIGR02466 family protein [Parafrankia sp. BMG5.11]|uniref:TIGR02466 family protein n=1 Tax=Parafrankia sp. BMG5.11 TaxID=222540 RepID=UPI0010409A78|nr:TIGR02466 family protein [Parafrankia sp. BMG5.11]TCJ36581.1 hypothetical protein E0504_22890 [Parafrankia sp. BMG5.11]